MSASSRVGATALASIFFVAILIVGVVPPAATAAAVTTVQSGEGGISSSPERVGPNTIDSCTVIKTSGIYSLTSNITQQPSADDGDPLNCLNVTVSDVVIDGNGYAIAYKEKFGSNDAESGVWIENSDGGQLRNVSVRNLTIGGTIDRGVYVNDTSDVTVEDSTFDPSSSTPAPEGGVVYDEVSQLTIRQNEFGTNLSRGVDVEAIGAELTTATIVNNRFNGADTGIRLSGTDILVESNNFFAYEDGIRFFSAVSDTRIRDNTFANQIADSFSAQLSIAAVSPGENNTIINNTLIDGADIAIKFEGDVDARTGAINRQGPNGTVIRKNRIDGGYNVGISITEATNNTVIENNTIQNLEGSLNTGIKTSGPLIFGTEISNTEIHNTSTGIELGGTANERIRGTVITDVTDGILLRDDTTNASIRSIEIASTDTGIDIGSSASESIITDADIEGPAPTENFGSKAIRISGNQTNINNATVSGYSRGIEFDGSVGSAITNSRATNFTATGVFFTDDGTEGNQDNILRNTHIVNSVGNDDSDGVFMQGGTAVDEDKTVFTTGNNTVQNTTIKSIAGDGIALDEAVRPIIQNNTIRQTGGGIHVQKSSPSSAETSLNTSATLIGNEIINNTGNGIRVFPGNHTTIINNTIRQNQLGIYIRNTDAPAIQNNTIADNDGSGILATGGIILYDGQNATVIDNNVTNNLGVGITIRASATNASIIGNTVSKSDTEGLVVINVADADISRNLITKATTGLRVDKSDTITTDSNRIINISTGIRIQDDSGFATKNDTIRNVDRSDQADGALVVVNAPATKAQNLTLDRNITVSADITDAKILPTETPVPPDASGLQNVSTHVDVVPLGTSSSSIIRASDVSESYTNLSFQYADADVENRNESTLRVYQQNSTTDGLQYAQQVPGLNIVDTTANVVTANITQFDSADDGYAPMSEGLATRDDTYSISDGETLTVPEPSGVLGNDSAPDTDTLSAEVVSRPKNGSLSLNTNGSFEYTPNSNFAGTDSFTYNASDGTLTDTATVIIVVNEVNDPPTAVNDSYNIDENTTLTVSESPGVLENDSDPDNDVLNVTPVSNPTNGTLSLNKNGSFSYTPNSSFTGTDSFRYNASDGTLTDTATVDITVNEVNDPPTAVNDSYNIDENTTLTVSESLGVLENDSDPDNDVLNATLVSNPTNGTLSLNKNGSFSYTPDSDFTGIDSFIYNASDRSLNSTGKVTITVEEVADAPANFAVSGFNPQSATVNVSEAFDVSATVENTGDFQGKQEIELLTKPEDGTVLTNTTVSLDPGANTTVTFDNVIVDTVGEFNQTVASANDSVSGTLTVEEPPTATVTFDNQSVQNGSTSVTVGSATFNGSGDFVIVVHRASPGENGVVNNTSEIDGKIGSSDVLTNNTVSDVPVNLTKNLDEGGNTQLTENQTLVAMLHFANESGDQNFGSPITRDGTPVFDQADITITGQTTPAPAPAPNISVTAPDAIGSGPTTVIYEGTLTTEDLLTVTPQFSDGNLTETEIVNATLRTGTGDFVPVNVSTLLNGTAEIETNSTGEFAIAVEFADGVSTTETFTASLPASQRNTDVADTATDEFRVNTTFPSSNETQLQVDVDPGDLPGDGTESDPYEISNVSELQAMEDDLGANYTLVSDIDASDTAQFNNGSGFDPVGGNFRESTLQAFSGSFDGNNHTVTGLTIDRPDEDNVGLFGVTGSGATVTDVTLADVTVTGVNQVGGVVGRNEGNITDSSASVSVTGDTQVGGLVGQNLGAVKNATASGDVTAAKAVGGLVGNNNGGPIRNATASGSVTGTARDSDVGGLVGVNFESITDSSASGSVTGTARDSDVGGLVGVNFESITDSSASGSVTGTEDVGGLVGENDNLGTIRNATASGSVTSTGVSGIAGGLVGDNGGTIRDTFAVGPVTGNDDVGGHVGNNDRGGTVRQSYFDTQATNQKTSAGSATGLTTAQMQGQAARTNMSGLDFDTTWTTTSEYPALRVLSETDESAGSDDPIQVDIDTSDLSGDGSESNPYQISNVSELQAMEDDLDANYTLVSDIDASQTAQFNDGRGFDPVGNFSDGFTGSFDGNNHSITGLTIDRPNDPRVGVFGVNDGTVSNISVIGLTVTGDLSVGGLVGTNDFDATIKNARASGIVAGEDDVGGLVGSNFARATIQNVTTSVTVDATGDQVGGLVGDNFGQIQIARSSGFVIGKNSIGGLAGRSGPEGGSSDSIIQNASAFGDVSGDRRVGGVVGQNTGSSINASAFGNVTGDQQVGGVVGTNTIILDDGEVVAGAIQDTFAVGAVSGNSDVGGLVGNNTATEAGTTGTVEQSYFDINTTGQDQDTSAGGIGLTTAQMQGSAAEDNMGGFDFGGAWETRTDPDDYPTLIALPQQTDLAQPDPDPEPIPKTTVTFENQTVINGSTTVTVASAQFGNQSVPGEDFVVVVHETDDGVIGTKIGESRVLKGNQTQSTISVNLSKQVINADDVARVTEPQQLVAMLHTANTTSGDNNHGTNDLGKNPPVTDRAQVGPLGLQTIETNITGNSLNPGEPVTLTATVANEGGTENSTQLTLIRDGDGDDDGDTEQLATSNVSAASDKTAKISFTVTPTQTETFSVQGPASSQNVTIDVANLSLTDATLVTQEPVTTTETVVVNATVTNTGTATGFIPLRLNSTTPTANGTLLNTTNQEVSPDETVTTQLTAPLSLPENSDDNSSTQTLSVTNLGDGNQTQTVDVEEVVIAEPTAITNATVRVGSGSVQPGETTTVNLTIDQTPQELSLSQYNLTVELTGTGTGTTDLSVTDVTAGAVAERPTAVTDTTVGELNQTVEIQAQNLSLAQNQTNISVGSLTVAANETATEGEVGLTVSVSEITDGSGIPIDESTETGGVTITGVETVQPPETETGTENDGFGVLPAVIALICLSLIARKRLQHRDED